MDEKEYIATVKEGVDWREVREDPKKRKSKTIYPIKVQVDDLREPTNVIRTIIHQIKKPQNLEKILE